MIDIKSIYDADEISGDIPVDKTILLVDAIRDLTRQASLIASGISMTWIAIAALTVAVCLK